MHHIVVRTALTDATVQGAMHAKRLCTTVVDRFGAIVPRMRRRTSRPTRCCVCRAPCCTRTQMASAGVMAGIATATCAIAADAAATTRAARYVFVLSRDAGDLIVVLCGTLPMLRAWLRARCQRECAARLVECHSVAESGRYYDSSQSATRSWHMSRGCLRGRRTRMHHPPNARPRQGSATEVEGPRPLATAPSARRTRSWTASAIALAHAPARTAKAAATARQRLRTACQRTHGASPGAGPGPRHSWTAREPPRQAREPPGPPQETLGGGGGLEGPAKSSPTPHRGTTAADARHLAAPAAGRHAAPSGRAGPCMRAPMSAPQVG